MSVPCNLFQPTLRQQDLLGQILGPAGAHGALVGPQGRTLENVPQELVSQTGTLDRQYQVEALVGGLCPSEIRALVSMLRLPS